ncbi:YrhK family protein [Aeromicrobium sp. 50.2.37]|uniref:YrhK family protein n=1 Tax=Aeromicrobium sp. 50.2.37 TaxID=2969305 RepID=UPI00214FF47A|nr:YrhK family protein [Aeromicrobium sp. 50.2.37]MCR4514595.1 YrhK family protein [Aeromicrobium sp. 50.2.37]
MSKDDDLTLTVGRETLVIRQRYETLSIVNDVLVALWFLAGSILFFWESTTTIGTWFFVAGSVELLVRPLIRLVRRFHLQRAGDPSRRDDFLDG